MKKYFTELLGNEENRERVGRAITDGTLPHAFLIGGPEGSGKRTFAKLIAAGVNCKGAGVSESLPCMRCQSCKKIMAEAFVDLKFFGRQKDKATIGVDDMRLLKEDAMLSGTESEAKIYVIDDAHTLTVESQNALLNILEEPPRGVTVILLATECDKILTTIKSRVQYIPMTRFTDEEIEAFAIENIPEAKDMKSFAPKKFSGVIKNSEGVIGRAIRLFKKGEAEKNDEERGEILAIVEAFAPKAPYEKLHSALAELPQKRAELMLYLEKIIMAVRDLVVIKEAKGAKLTFFVSDEEAENLARAISIKRLLNIYDALILSHEYCSKNANVGTIVANLEGKIKLA